MSDPRLNSLHLDPTRRQDFRRARDVLLQARGSATLYAENNLQDSSEPGNTFIQQTGTPIPSTLLDVWLADKDYLYPLKVGLNTMGRSSDNDIVVEDLYISRRHCAVLVHHDKTCILQDIASKNGTYLNGVRISGPTPLRIGDEIRICNHQFIFQSNVVPSSGDSGNPTRTIAS